MLFNRVGILLEQITKKIMNPEKQKELSQKLADLMKEYDCSLQINQGIVIVPNVPVVEPEIVKNDTVEKAA